MTQELYYQLLIQQAEAKARYETITKLLQEFDNHKEPTTDTPIGVMIRDARTNRNLDQKTLAEMVGYGVGGHVSISRIETGKAVPAARNLKAFADALGLDYAKIYQARTASLKTQSEQK